MNRPAPYADTATGADLPAHRPSGPLVTAMTVLRRITIDALRRYHRHEVTLSCSGLDEPVLFVANHGFGGIIDVNVLATLAALDDLRLTRPVTILTHEMAWTFKVGKLVEAVGAGRAARATAIDAFTRGHHVLVFPGGDIETSKSFADRNKIVFSGRRGFAKLARDVGAAIVPVVTAGAGESLLVLTDGQSIARTLRLDRTLRMKAAPVSVSLPWGVNVGLVGMFLPYLPLPSKLSTCVLGPMQPLDAEPAEAFGDRVESVMQAVLTDLTRDRVPVLG